MEHNHQENDYSHDYSTSSSESFQDGDEKPKVSGYSHDYSSESHWEEGDGAKPNGTMKVNEKMAQFGTEIKENKDGKKHNNFQMSMIMD